MGTVSNDLKTITKKHLYIDEGLKLLPYKCTAGKLTIGVGRNLEGRGISNSEADYLLDNDIDYFIDQLGRKLPWFDSLDDARKYVLINMCFNLGINGLLEFKKTLKYVYESRFIDAANEMLNSRWAKQVGERANRLSDVMATGKLK